MRFFLGKNGSTVVDKQVYSGDDSKADQLVANYLSNHPGFTALEVDQATFDSTVVTVDPTSTRNDALNALATGSSGDNKLERAILLVILDEINVIRAALSLSARTANQFKTAIQNKINSGAAD